MEGFITWDMFLNWASFVSIVLLLTQFTKDMKAFKKIKTKYWSFLIAFILLFIFNLQAETFKVVDIVLYIISSSLASMNANGIYDFAIKK